MNKRTQILGQLVKAGMYVADEFAVAGAILARAQLRTAIAEPEFRSDRRGPAIRSFRRDPDARSFRLVGGPNLRVHHR